MSRHEDDLGHFVTNGRGIWLEGMGRLSHVSSRSIPDYSRCRLIPREELRTCRTKKWNKKLEDGRRVKFIYQELPEDGAFITAQVAGNEIVYSVVLAKAGNPLSREDVEGHFKGELAKK
jgi:hypothetical protein